MTSSPGDPPAWIDLDGAANVRDIGGLTASGGHTRPGVVLRADGLDALSAADVVRLVERWGLAHVVDLRSEAERRERGRGRLGARPGIVYTEVQIIDEDQLELRRVSRAERLAEGMPTPLIMAEGYAQLLDWGAGAFVRAFGAVAGMPGTPALVHCSAGKDRTGILVALLLGAAGVEAGAIVADYAATQERMAAVVARLETAERFANLAGTIQSFVFDAQAETMQRFLDHLDSGWGGAAGWLEANGVAPAQLADWRDRLIAAG